MTQTTPESVRMGEIVADHMGFLKAAGFRKRRHSFNRPVGDGLVHVVKFWMAPKEPPAWTEVPGLRERLYGAFRLDFGVYVPEMNRSMTPRGQWINDYDCHLRKTVGELASGESTGDFWWALDDPLSSIEAGEALSSLGLPWLDRFPDATSVLDAFDRLGPYPLGMVPAGALDIADLCRGRGDQARARRVLETYVASPVGSNHVNYLERYLTERGHGDLIPLISVHS